MKTRAEIDAMFQMFVWQARNAKSTGIRWVMHLDARPDGSIDASVEEWHGERRVARYRAKMMLDESGVLRRIP